MLIPNNAEFKPEYSPAMPSRWMICRTASRVEDCARFDSTCARVDNVIRGYLVNTSWSAYYIETIILNPAVTGSSYVKIIDRIPPPDPANAWAMLSDCCTAADTAAALFCCSTGAWDILFFWEDIAENVSQTKVIHRNPERRLEGTHVVEEPAISGTIAMAAHSRRKGWVKVVQMRLARKAFWDTVNARDIKGILVFVSEREFVAEEHAH